MFVALFLGFRRLRCLSGFILGVCRQGMNKKNIAGIKSEGMFVVLCCICEKTRNNKGKWVARKHFPAQNSGVVYSHGMCPNCVKNMYGNELWYKQYEKDPAGKILSGGGCMGGMKKMLVIDDNSMIRTLLTADFEDEFKVEVAENATEGFVLAMSWRPDVILLDINMPDVSGVDVMRRLGSRPETKEIPVIVITASEYNDRTRRELQFYGNFKGFLSKMTPTEEIRKTVWGVLR